MDPEGLEICSVAPELPRDCPAPSSTPFCCGLDGVTGRTACGSTPPAPKIQTSPVTATRPSCWG